MEQQDLYFMQAALQQARLAWKLNNEVPVGAVLVQNQQIIARGSNAPISNLDPTAHAEIMAIRSAAQLLGNYRLVNSILYVTLEPCVMCVGAILHARINRLVFGAKDPKFGALGSVIDITNYSWNHKFSCVGGILDQDCGLVLKEFFASKRQ